MFLGKLPIFDCLRQVYVLTRDEVKIPHITDPWGKMFIKECVVILSRDSAIRWAWDLLLTSPFYSWMRSGVFMVV